MATVNPEPPSDRRYFTQWAAQFFVAAELTRRRYMVAFTLGNARGTDLFVKSPAGVSFTVECKGQSTRNFWRLQRHEPDENRYYTLVCVPPELAPQFFVLTNNKCQELREDYKVTTVAKGGKYHERFGGFNWTAPIPHKDCWSILPV